MTARPLDLCLVCDLLGHARDADDLDATADYLHATDTPEHHHAAALIARSGGDTRRALRLFRNGV